MCNVVYVREDSPTEKREPQTLPGVELGYLQALTIVRCFGFLFEREKSEVKGRGYMVR